MLPRLLARAALRPALRPAIRPCLAAGYARPAAADAECLMLPMVRQTAPEITAKSVQGGEIVQFCSSELRGKYQVLLFYPLDFTFVCPTEIIAFDKAIGKFHALNAEVVAISVDSEYSHLAWTRMPRAQGGLGAELKVTLVADMTKKIAKAYGVLLPQGIAARGLIIVDPKGIVRHVTINDLPIGRSVDEALRVIQAIEHSEQHGEVCPANWTPGAPAIKPNPTDAKSYFKNAN